MSNIILTVLGTVCTVVSIPNNANEEGNSTVCSNGRKFLDNSKGLDVISLLVKYYLPLAHINKVIKFLNFKYARICSVFNGRRNRESTTNKIAIEYFTSKLIKFTVHQDLKRGLKL